jgi:hypothetical protein
MLISRTGRYKGILLSAMGSLVVGNVLMTRLTAQTDSVVLWTWMLLIGVGVGPAMAGYTVVVQSIVARDRLGVATSTLTFLRQIGGSVGLALAGTLFMSTFTHDLPGKLVAGGVPARIAARIASRSGGNLTGVGSLGKQVGASLSPQLQALIPRIVTGIHEAVAGAVASLFWLGAGAGTLALVATLLIREVPLRGAAGAAAVEQEVEGVQPGRTEAEPAR